MPLSDAACRALKPAATIQKKTDANGLQLWIRPSGQKSWVFNYRFGGKQKTYTIGKYPLISLVDARAERDHAKRLLAKNIDPSDAKRQAKRAQGSTANTFQVIAEEYVAKMQRENRAPSTLKKTRWLHGLANPEIGNRKIDALQPSDVLFVLKLVQARGCRDSAHRLLAAIGAVCRFACQTARATNDPTTVLRGSLDKVQVKHRPAFTSASALGGFLRALDDYQGDATTKAALLLLVLLFPRPGELRQAQWVEFDFIKQVWTTPAARMKSRIEHHVPLSGLAVQILQDLRKLKLSSKFVFPSLQNTSRPMSDGTLNAALRIMGFSKDQVTAHGFRATASTLLNESNLWHPDTIERQLAHNRRRQQWPQPVSKLNLKAIMD